MKRMLTIVVLGVLFYQDVTAKLPSPKKDKLVCRTFNECRRMHTCASSLLKDVAATDDRIASLVGQTADPALTPIAKDESGNILLMNQYEAIQYCKNEYGTNLPTARQWAQYAVRYGAKISKTSKNSFYYAIYKQNKSAKRLVDFYFDGMTYRQPSGEEGNLLFWSSSIDHEYSGLAYYFDGRTGHIGAEYRIDYDLNSRPLDGTVAVRCVARR